MYYCDLTVTEIKINKQSVSFVDLSDNRTGNSLPSFEVVPFVEPAITSPMTIVSDLTETGFNIFIDKPQKGQTNIETTLIISE